MLFQGKEKSGPEKLGKRLDREKETVSSREPGSVGGKSAAWSQVMNMRVISQVACPGMEHADQPDLPADETRVLGEFLGGLRRSLEQKAVEQALVAAGKLTQLRREREGEHEVRCVEQQAALEFKPILGLLMLALGTMAVAAGVVAVTHFPATGTLKDLSTQGFGATLLDGTHGLAVRRQQVFSVLLPVGGAISAENLGQF